MAINDELPLEAARRRASRWAHNAPAYKFNNSGPICTHIQKIS